MQNHRQIAARLVFRLANWVRPVRASVVLEEEHNSMSMSLSLMKKRRFLPLFVTQFLNAFNDNFFKMAMVVLITYTILQGGEKEEAYYNAFAGAIFILPFFLLSAVSGQLADSIDKTRVIRMVKSAEIGIMIVGACGIWLHNVPLMFLALFAMGMHSTQRGRRRRRRATWRSRAYSRCGRVPSRDGRRAATGARADPSPHRARTDCPGKGRGCPSARGPGRSRRGARCPLSLIHI